MELFSMLRQNHIWHCLLAALVTVHMAVQAANAQSVSGDDVALPDAGDVVAAYMTLRTWTDRLEGPPPGDAAASLPLRDAAGVSVTLRRFGRVIGFSSSLNARQGEMMTRRAWGRAMAQALGDRAVTALPEEVRSEIGRGLTLELEVAGQMQPLLGRTWQRIARELEPGIDGVAVRQGDQWAALFPSQLLSSNTAGNVATRLPALAAELRLPAVELSVLLRDHNISVYRFRTLHLAQSDPRSFPFETVRGDQVVADSQVTTRGIQSFADHLALHLLNKIHDRTVDDDGTERPALGLLGDYQPVADSYRPLTAPPIDQALVSFALSQYSLAPGVNVEVALRAREQAGRLLRDLHATHQQDSVMLNDPTVAASIVYAATAYRGHSREDVAIAAIAGAAVEAISRIDAAEVRSAHARAMIAGAAARMLVSEQDGDANDASAVRGLLDAAWQAVPEHQHISLLPWIGWGELDFAQATGEAVQQADQLRQVRELLDASRVTAADVNVAPDLFGGFALADGIASRPTAQVTRPAAFLATMLREGQLTGDDEVAGALGRHLQTMRFLMQLSVREESTWSMRNAQRALGGIRAATWDSDMPNAAQVMALLTATEALQSLGR